MVFTYTDFVANNQSVWVSVFQQVTWHSSLNGTTRDTAFPNMTIDGGCAGNKQVSGVVLGQKPGGGGVPGKVGDFPYADATTYPLDAKPSRLSLLRWGLYAGRVTEDNYAETWSIEDTAGENQEFICEAHPTGLYTKPTLTYRAIGSQELDVPVPEQAVRVTCTPQHLRVDVNPAMGGVYWDNELILQFFTKTTDGTRPGQTYFNTATVNGTPYKGSARRPNFGAEGGGRPDGFGSLEIRKNIVSSEDASNARFTFEVTCTDGRKETVTIDGANTTIVDGIEAGASCEVTEVDPPSINKIPATVKYSVNGENTQTITINDTDTVTMTVTNTYPDPPVPPTPQDPPVPPTPKDPPVPPTPKDPPVLAKTGMAGGILLSSLGLFTIGVFFTQGRKHAQK